MKLWIETRLLSGANENISVQESFSIGSNALEGFDPVNSPNRTTYYEFMGAKYKWDVSMGRFFLIPSDNPENVDTLVLLDKIATKGVGAIFILLVLFFYV